MPKALQVITGRVVAPGATFTAWNMNTGDSATIANASLNSQIFLLEAWAFNQVAGTLRIRSPKLHDLVQGIRMRVTAADVETLLTGKLDPGFKQPLYPQDNLTIEQTGSGTAGQIELGTLMLYYSDLPGVSARLTDPDTVRKAGVNLVTQEVTITAGTNGDYTGAVAINSSFDTLKANTDYALLGGYTDTRVCTVGVRGVDFGNLRVGFPGEPSQRSQTGNFFMRMAQSHQLPLVPVFNSANKAGILVDVATNQAGGTVVVTLICCELKPGAVPGAMTPTAGGATA